MRVHCQTRIHSQSTYPKFDENRPMRGVECIASFLSNRLFIYICTFPMHFFSLFKHHRIFHCHGISVGLIRITSISYHKYSGHAQVVPSEVIATQCRDQILGKDQLSIRPESYSMNNIVCVQCSYQYIYGNHRKDCVSGIYHWPGSDFSTLRPDNRPNMSFKVKIFYLPVPESCGNSQLWIGYSEVMPKAITTT